MNRIKQLRNELGWSQEKLAKKIGANSQQLMSSYERGETEPSVDAYLIMSELFDADIPYIKGTSDIRRKSSRIDINDDDIDIAFYEGYKDLEDEDKEVMRNTLKAFLRNKNKK